MLLQEREDKAFCSYKSVVQAEALVSIATFDIVRHPFYMEKRDYLEFEILHYNEIPL